MDEFHPENTEQSKPNTKEYIVDNSIFKIIYGLRSHDNSRLAGKRMGCDFWGSDDILFVDLGIESIDVFTL